jgi:hypothetical protein
MCLQKIYGKRKIHLRKSISFKKRQLLVAAKRYEKL